MYLKVLVKSEMDVNEQSHTLPLPVKEIVKHMRRSFKTNRSRPRRRLSDICPTHSQRYPGVSCKPRCALTPTGLSSSQTFFPLTCTSDTVTSSKKSITSKKMDAFVSSPSHSAHFATSPQSSIYEQERYDSNRICGNSKFLNTSMDISDDICCLDDNIEDGSLETLLTPDVINTLRQSAAEFSWTGKPEDDVAMSSGCLNSNSTLTSLDMESDIPFVAGIINMDQNDGKLSMSCLDFFQNDISNSIGFSCAPLSLSTSELVQTTTDTNRSLETLRSSNDVDCSSKSSSTAGSNFIPNVGNLGHHFPPRACQPQIGVAAVIQPKLQNSAFPMKENDGFQKFHNHEEILSIKSEQFDNKSEVLIPTEGRNGSRCINSTFTDISAQIVPSESAPTTAFVKSEPKSLIKVESMEEKWQDVQSFMHSPENESLGKKRRRLDSGSSEHISDDDDNYDESSSYGDKDNDDSDDDYSDIDADLAHIKPSECESLVALGKKQKQFFWQYNVQSKGPKGTRLKLAVESPSDPHVLNDFEDPVFDVCNTTIAGIRHGGKARKGDGNEISPNPKKLFMIGHQLMRLNRQINACQLGTDVPLARRNESRKEKNKLASRACRLKKKAQHEANKIKLYGLEQEHSQLNSVLRFIWPHLRDKAKDRIRQIDKSPLSSTSTTLTAMLESQINKNLKSMIAGHTVEYVNSVILQVESGDFSGGLNIKKSHKT